MCDGSEETATLGTGSGRSTFGNTQPAPSVTRRQLLRFIDDFVVIDVRDPEEYQSASTSITDSGNNNNISDAKESESANLELEQYVPNLHYIPMSKVLSSKWLNDPDTDALLTSKKKICFVCNTHSRSAVTASFYNSRLRYKNCYYLIGGKKAWDLGNPVVFNDDWITINTFMKSDSEKCGLAIQLTLAAASRGKTVTLVLMHDAVTLATKALFNMVANDESEDNFVLHKTFKPWRDMIRKLLEFQCQILCCTSCCKIRNIKDGDLMEFARKIKGPNVIQMFDEGGHVMQWM